MIFFITFLRALAACLITNAHYTGIYPTDLLANGGLIGDVLFFAVSGYCLFHTKGSFLRWYGKRVWRVYPPVWIATAAFLLCGGYVLSSMSLPAWFLFPTTYHFVASILILYIPYYIIMKSSFLRERLPLIMAGIAGMALLMYIFTYDKSYYHIDNVREPFIRLLFMESMLLGAYFRQNDAKYRNAFSYKSLAGGAICFFAYFASKLLFAKVPAFSTWQWINQVLIFLLLYFLFRVFCGLDEKLSHWPAKLKTVVSFLADRTLEIYVVQYVLIDALRHVCPFPLNWLAVTAAILIAAVVLHAVCGKVYDLTDWIIQKMKRTEKPS